MNKCYFCKKEYGGYPVIVCNRLECFALEQHIKDIYYDNTTGVCKECRDKELYKNKVWMWKSLLNVRLMLEVILTKVEDAKAKKRYEEAIERVKKKDKEMEKLPEIRAEIMKNHPASFKELPKEKKICAYCGENYGQLWIDDPNEEDNPKIDNCWWVCIPCSKIIEKQLESSFLSCVQNRLEEKGVKISKESKKYIENLDKEIQDIAYEDCQETCCFEIKKNKDRIKVKRKY